MRVAQSSRIREILSASALSAFLLTGCALQSARLDEGRNSGELAFENGSTYSTARRELTILLPSVDLPAGVAYNDKGVTTALDTSFPLDGWIHGYSIEVIDSADKVMTTNMLHHITIVSPDQRELFSPIMLRIVAAGMETGAVRMPDSYGYPVRRGEKLSISAMLHNPDSVARGALRIRVRLVMTAASSGKTPARAFPFHIGLNEPATGPEFDLPAGRSVQQREARPAISGRVYALGGHLHQFGVSLKLEDLTAKKVVWSTAAVTDAEGKIVRIPSNRFPKLGVRIEAGHLYRVTSEYNNTTGEAIGSGGMALVGGLFIPDRNSAWPSVDGSDATYQKDVAMRANEGHKHTHKHGG